MIRRPKPIIMDQPHWYLRYLDLYRVWLRVGSPFPKPGWSISSGCTPYLIKECFYLLASPRESILLCYRKALPWGSKPIVLFEYVGRVLAAERPGAARTVCSIVYNVDLLVVIPPACCKNTGWMLLCLHLMISVQGNNQWFVSPSG